MIKTVKKLSKKSLAILIALLMIISVMPLTPPISVEAATDTSALSKAMQAFEEKMDGSVYTNMDVAYNAYVAASKAYDAAYYGGDTAVDVATPTTNLNNAVSQMVKKNLTAYTASGTARFSGDTSDISAAKGLLYSQQGVTYNSTTNTAHFAEKEVESRWNYGTSVEAELYHAPTVVLYDGTQDAKIPVISYVHSKTWGSSGTGKARIIGIAVSNSNYVSLQNSSWKGGDDDGQAFNTIYGKNDTNVSNSDNSTYLEWSHGNVAGVNYHNYDYFANLLTVSNTNLASLFSDNTYSKKIPNVTWNFYANGANGATKYNGSQTQSDNTPIYVVNYKPLRDAIVADANKSARSNAASYKEGGMSTYLAGCVLAAGLNPNSYSYSTDLTGQVSQCATDISNAVSKFKTLPSADNTTNYPALRNAFDYSGALAGFNNATYSVREAYNGGVNNGFTQASYNNFKAKYEAAQNVMKAVATSGYVNDGFAGEAATALTTAFNSLQHEHSFTGAYVINNDGTHSQKCVFYDKCQTMSDGTSHSYSSSVTTQPTCTTAGVTTHTCVCGDSYTTNEPAAKGHTEIEIPAVEATCTTAGSTAGTKCSVCGEILVAPTTIDALGHDMKEVADSAKDPTCTEAGKYADKACSRCDYTETGAIINATGHSWREDEEVPADCTNPGTNAGKTCTVCSVTEGYGEIPAKGHKWREDEEVPADCTNSGTNAGKTCTECGATEGYGEIPAKGHTEGTPVEENRVNATCTVDGSYDSVVYCTVCNAEISREKKTIDKLGHSYTSVVTAPTCTEQGYTTYTCSRGDHIYVDNYVPAKGHTAGTPVEENRVNATCTVDGSYDEVVYCTVCKEEISREKKTIDKLGHNFTNYVSDKNATCTQDGTKTAKCDRCDVTDTKTDVDSKLGHDFTVFEKLDENSHTVKCSRNCNEEDWTYTEAHTMDGNTCSKCGYVAKVTITFKAKDGSVIRSDEYAIGDVVTAPALPDSECKYNSNKTHTVVTYAWDSMPQTTAQTEATYKVVSSSETVACTFTLTNYDIKDGDITKDEFTCSKCGGKDYKVVADKTALNAAIDALENDFALPEAGYKYDAARVQAANKLIEQAKALGRYEEQSVVNAKAEAIATAKTELNAKENLAKYNLNFKILNYSENNSVIAEYTDGFENLAYGTTVDFHEYVIPTINDDSSLSGLPKYAVYKWVKIVNGKEQKLNTTDIKISDVVKSNATYICYLMNFKATDETKNETRVRYIDKSGNTIDFDTATVGDKYEINDSVKAPLIPYYDFAGWNLVFGNADEVGTREVVFQATYNFKDTISNRCEIVGLNGVMVNGVERCSAIYDQKIELTGADRFAYADENGNVIAPINENYIFAPHLNGVDKTIYITKVEAPVENATIILTGTFTTKDDPTYNYLVVNSQFYLPEGATAVTWGTLVDNRNDESVIKVGTAKINFVADKQGENHEYSTQMSYSKGKTGTLYARSYLIYIDKNGATQTVYSDIAECVLD